jgi:hypothetical protein
MPCTSKTLIHFHFPFSMDYMELLSIDMDGGTTISGSPSAQITTRFTVSVFTMTFQKSPVPQPPLWDPQIIPTNQLLPLYNVLKYKYHFTMCISFYLTFLRGFYK